MYEFESLSPQQASELLQHLSFDWWICSGWAIELFVGEKVREHNDIDVAILRRDHTKLPMELPSLDFKIASKGVLHDWNGNDLPEDIHALWSRRKGSDRWLMEFLINESTDADWLFRKNKEIQHPLIEIHTKTAENIPFFRPVIPLLYKSAYCLEKDELDFKAALPLLSQSERKILKKWIRTFEPACRWLEEL